MKFNSDKTPQLVVLESHKSDKRGTLFSIEDYELGVPIKRAFFITDFSREKVLNNRGNHSHSDSSQYLINIKGDVTIKVVNILNLKEYEFILDSPKFCLYLPENHHIFMNYYSEDAVMLVLSDKSYEDDKINKYFIPENLDGFRDVAEYLNISLKSIIDEYNNLYEVCTDRMKFKHLTDVEFRKLFQDKEPSNNELIEFYKNTDNYILELTEYHSTYARHNVTREVLRYLKDNDIQEVLDFGCGIGEDSITLLDSGIKTSLCDIEGKTFDFAMWRMKKRGYSPKSIKIGISSQGDVLNHTNFGAIMCFEVLMHVPEPLETLDMLYSHLDQGGYLFLTHRFKGNYSLALEKNKDFENTIDEDIKQKGFSLIDSIPVWDGKELYVYKKL